mmetsp:Transcript_30538/g.90685  ORF Transcript_30538/g.90685 Transcript_30538/m.90685 type:complete len:82 (+) Transcript_30538:186-431(+)
MKVEAFAGQRVVAVSAGASHSLALTADGAFWSWGGGGEGQLGHGIEQNQPLPSPPMALSGAGAKEPMASWATATGRTNCCR